jgi:hypothetical protein
MKATGKKFAHVSEKVAQTVAKLKMSKYLPQRPF